MKGSPQDPQRTLLTDSLESVLRRLYPTGVYFVGVDCGIRWRGTDPPECGIVTPSWYLIPDVPPKRKGEQRRIYHLWEEHYAPLLVLDLTSGDGTAERDRTPFQGKAWIYEKAIGAAFYGLFTTSSGKLEVYTRVGADYPLVPANGRGHYEIGPLQVELGLWEGIVGDRAGLWLRWWDLAGNLLMPGWEALGLERRQKEMALRQAAEAMRRADDERLQNEQAQRRAELLAERLRAAGLDPNVP